MNFDPDSFIVRNPNGFTESRLQGNPRWEGLLEEIDATHLPLFESEEEQTHVENFLKRHRLISEANSPEEVRRLTIFPDPLGVVTPENIACIKVIYDRRLELDTPDWLKRLEEMED